MARRGLRSNRIKDKDPEEKKPQKLEFTYQFKVKETKELLEFLLEKMNTSRNVCKQLLSNNQVLVNGALERQYNLMLAKEDEVKISKRPIHDDSFNKKPKKRNINRPKKIDIIYEDKDFIAIDKPEGLLSIENGKDIVSAYSYVSEYLRLNNKLDRPFVIHRIDKETSGVLVFAKNPYVQSKLRLEWNKYVVLREYIALVEGEMPKKSDRIVVNLLEDKNNMVYVAKGHDGKTSITNYEVIKTDGKYSLLRVLIDTGRKNQIRVVLANLGHPIVDDDKYGSKTKTIGRLGLHASKLIFKHPFTNEELVFETRFPKAFNIIK